MNYLVDTHYILWTLFNPYRISENILSILENEKSIKYVSAISFWEISLKYAIEKLELHNSDPEEVYENTLSSGFQVLPLESSLLATYFRLPLKQKHKDPFDRMLIWQAICSDLILVTKDKKIKEYIQNGLKVVIGS